MFFKKDNGIKEVDSIELNNMIKQEKDMILLDVRRYEEWSQTGIIKDSLMVTNTNLIAEMQQGLNLKQDKPVIAICRSGQRSMQVAKYLHAQGIEAINLKGGIIDWLNNQFEVEQI